MMELTLTSPSDGDTDPASQPLASIEPPSPTTTKVHTHRSRFNLYLASGAANMASFSIGNCFTWTSPTLPLLQEPNNILQITTEQSSWIGSLIAFGAIFGPLLAGALVNRIGRKHTITLSVCFIVLSWLLLLVGRSVALMCVARFVAGVGGGIIYTVVPMYVAEIAEDSLRGPLVSMMSFSVCCGFLLVYLVGPVTSYSTLILVCLLPTLLFLVLFPAIMPETPYYLLQTGQNTRALKSLLWLRRGACPQEIDRELNQMKVSVNTAQHETGGQLMVLLTTTAPRKGLLLSCGLVAGQQLSGINVVIFYAESIFRETGSQLSPALCSTLVAVILILSSGAAPPLVNKFGMKTLLAVSAAGMGVFQGILGCYFYSLHLNVDLTSVGWLPIVSLVGYIMMYAIGFGPLPWAVMAEMFPPHIKALGSAVTTSVCWLFAFLMTKYFVIISATLGEFISFWMFTLFCLLMIFFTLLLLPDTRGKSFDEIQCILKTTGTKNRTETPR